MKFNKKLLITAIVLFVLFLISYPYSLYHSVSQLPYLNSPDTVTGFQRLLTYTLMMIGILPTILIIIYTSVFCTTAYPNYVVATTCFGNPFSFSDSGGFFAYIIASILTTIVLTYLVSIFSSVHQPGGPQK